MAGIINETIPEDLQIEILLKEPLKSLLRLMSVSKKWESIIRGKQFRDRYLRKSMTRPRLLFAFCRTTLMHEETPDVLFQSVYQEEKPLLSSGQQQMLFDAHPVDYICAPIRGLVCLLQKDERLVICNPGTKKFLHLPEFGDGKVNFKIFCYFGYDEATDVFKVLCTYNTCRPPGAKHYVCMKHVVITVGEDSWREIVCENRYLPMTNALCKGGVLYYGGWRLPDDKSIVVSFNVRSEEFKLIDLPEGVKINFHPFSEMVYYKEEIALYSNVTFDGEVQVWIWKESEREWREERVEIPKELVGGRKFSFKGAIGTGELVFKLWRLVDGSHVFLYYNPVTQILRESKIEGVAGMEHHYAETFLDHVDSFLLT